MPEKTTVAPKRNKLFAIVGIALLVVSLLTAAIALLNIKDFSTDEGVDVKANKAYYLLADAEALQATQCVFQDSEQRPIAEKISNLEIMVGDDLQVQDIALPFTDSKGVFAKLTFSEDLAGAHQKCDSGTSYISTFSGTTLNILRWMAVLTFVAAAAFFIAFVLIRPRRAQQRAVDPNATSTKTEGSERTADTPTDQDSAK